MKKSRIFIYLTYMFLLLIILVSCSSDAKLESKYNQVKIDKSSPQKIIEESYKFETKINAKLLAQCFYQLKSDVSFLMLKIKCFNVEKVSLTKLAKIEQKDNFAVASCVYSTYFSGIITPRQDIEVVKFIKDKDGWCILSNVDDVINISEEDRAWLNSTEIKQKNYIWTDESTRKVLDSQTDFDESNKKIMEAGSEKLKAAMGEK